MKHRSTFIDLTNQIIGRWKVLHESPRVKIGESLWVCQCSCGVIKNAVRYTALTKNRSLSCGCLRKELRSKPIHELHGQRNPTYRVWMCIRTRCLNDKHPSYANYGARGISLCERWRSFDNFLEDMGPRPDGASIERINNNLGYSKENCKWAGLLEQGGNKRSNLKVRHRNQTMNLIDVARLENVDYPLLRKRFKDGQSLDWAINALRDRGQFFHERAACLGGTPCKTNHKRRKREPKMNPEQLHAYIMEKMKR